MTDTEKLHIASSQLNYSLYQHSSVIEVLTYMSWDPLEVCCNKSRLCLFYKFTHSYYIMCNHHLNSTLISIDTHGTSSQGSDSKTDNLLFIYILYHAANYIIITTYYINLLHHCLIFLIKRS